MRNSNTLKVLEALQLSTEFLEKKGIESARTNAELLLAEILGCNRLGLYLAFERPLNEDEKKTYREFIARRAKFEPLQYIVGSVEFFGLKFIVNEKVLIPRPETELLVENILNLVDTNKHLNILDIGSGSGNISIALAKNIEHCVVTGVDISEDAVLVAAQNSKLNNVESKVKFFVRDIYKFSNEPEQSKYDIIVSNPPYVGEKEYLTLQEEIVKYEPKIAVTDFSDGYNFYKEIISLSGDILNRGGYLFFEAAEGQSKKIIDILNDSKFTNVNCIKDYSQIDRIIYGQLK
jgi:release factor glutamine methyltransferase